MLHSSNFFCRFGNISFTGDHLGTILTLVSEYFFISTLLALAKDQCCVSNSINLGFLAHATVQTMKFWNN